MKKLMAVLFLLSLIFCRVSSSSAKDAVKGDVIVVLRNSSGVRINSAKTAGGVKSLSAVKSFAASQKVNVIETFDALSDAGNKIFMVVHSDTENENELLRKIKSRPDVISASLNHIYTLNLPETPNDSEYFKLYRDRNRKTRQAGGRFGCREDGRHHDPRHRLRSQGSQGGHRFHAPHGGLP